MCKVQQGFIPLRKGEGPLMGTELESRLPVIKLIRAERGIRSKQVLCWREFLAKLGASRLLGV
jgi:hypothetical protein